MTKPFLSHGRWLLLNIVALLMPLSVIAEQQQTKAVSAPSETAQNWASAYSVGDQWPGLTASDQNSKVWQPAEGKATLYVFSRSVVW